MKTQFILGYCFLQVVAAMIYLVTVTPN